MGMENPDDLEFLEKIEPSDQIIDAFERVLTPEQKQGMDIDDAAAAVVDCLEGKTFSDLANDPAALQEVAERAAAKLITKPIVNDRERTGRNEQCSCGSGKKYKKCCGKRS